MIIDLKFEQLKPRCVPAYQTEFEKALPARQALSPLRGFWRTEVGDIDSVWQLWTYDDLAQRAQVLAAEAQLPGWPHAGANETVMEQDSLLIAPAPFSPPITERRLGNIYELRIYTYEPGLMPTVSDRWQEKLEARLRLSPLVFCGHTVGGRLNQWVHLWAYENAVERQRIRAESLKQKIWPPDARAGLIRQRNMLLIPSDFSPLH